MREQYKIDDFSKGIITIADSADIPDEACVYSENADPSEGLLTPVKIPSTVSGTGTVPNNAKQTAFAIKDSDSTGLLYTCTETTNHKVKLIDEYSSAFSSTAVELSSGTTGEYQVSQLIARDKEIRLPRWTSWQPKIFKYYDFAQFGKKNLSKPSVSNTHPANTKERVYVKGTCSGTTGDTYTVQALAYEKEAWANNTPSAGWVQIRFTNPDSIKPTPDTRVDLLLMDSDTILATISEVEVFIRENSGGWNLVDWQNSAISTPISSTILDNTTNIGFRMHNSTAPIMWKKNSGSWTVEAYTNSWTTLTDGLSLAVLDAVDFVPGFVLTYTAQSSYLYETTTEPASSLSAVSLSLTKSGTGTYFATGKKYFYKYSIVYDYTQETKLNDTAQTVDGAEDEKVTVTVTVSNSDFITFSRRITAINIYRGEASNTGLLEPEGYYRIIASFDVIDESLVYDTTTGKIKFTYDDYGNWAGSYESITGISEGLSVLTPNYTYGVFSGNRLYTIGNYIADEPEAARMLLMSQPFKYDTFNWDLDYVMLDSMPKGIGEFRGTIFVFGKNVIWKINPDNLNIDQSFTGYDLLDQNSILTTEYGLLFCTTNGVYIIDTTGVNELSYPIANKDGVNSGITTAVSWKEFYHSNIRLYIYFDEGKKSFIIYDAYKEAALVYYIPKKAWWYWKFATSATNTTSCLFYDSSQNVFYSNGTNLKKFYGGNYATLTWISKLITLGNYRQKKRLQKIKYKGDGTLVYGLDNATPASSVTNEDGAVTYAYFNTIQLKLTLSTGSNKLIFKAVEMLYRAMKGLR